MRKEGKVMRRTHDLRCRASAEMRFRWSLRPGFAHAHGLTPVARLIVAVPFPLALLTGRRE